MLHGRAERVKRSIDYVGMALLAGGLTSIVLYTSLGGDTYGWWSAPMLVLLVLSMVATAGFILAERRAAEPILPLSLFRNRIFTISSVIGFIVGVSLFGSVTYIPLYLQIVKGASPTQSGLEMLPLMGGVLLTSIGSGQLISRFGRYKVFPIVGTALMAVGMLLLSRLTAGTSMVLADLYMFVVGLGLGFVMQVLILAVQNAVEYRDLGVATASATLFRSMGGTIGVPIFGAIFTNQLAGKLAQLPAGAAAQIPAHLGPGSIAALPDATRTAYIDAYANSLHPGVRAGGAPRAHRVRVHLVAAGTPTTSDRGRPEHRRLVRLSPRPRIARRAGGAPRHSLSSREPLSHLQARRRNCGAATRA